MQKDKPVSLPNDTSKKTIVRCLHCHDALLASQREFCCEACKMVYSILQGQNLGAYYALRDETSEKEQRFPKPQYVEASQTLGEESLLPQGQHRFYIQGVHCTACLWLIEKLPLFIPDISSARMDISTHILTLELSKDNTDRNTIVQQLQHWGYKATWLAEAGQEERLATAERHNMLWRIGIAAFCSGNLMILSLAFYTGIEGTLARYFEALSLLLALPVLLYSAWPFYQKGLFNAVKTRRFSSDTPIALSLLFGGTGSIYELIWGSQQLYFDSLSILVFLLLFSRYLLLRTQQRIWSDSHPHFENFTDKIARKTDSGIEKVALESLSIGDHIRVFQGQTFAVDGKITLGHSRVDQALLTGEPYPLKVAPGDWVYRGTQNQQNALDIEVLALGDQTRLGKIIATAKHFSSQKSRWIRAAEKSAQVLAFGIVIMSAIIFFRFWEQPTIALSRFLALSIIACPCGLALATPLVFHLALKSALNKGIFIRHPNSLEALPSVNTLVFDKTGTLTQGCFDVLWSQSDFFDAEVSRAVLALESCSQHPVAASLVRYIQNQQAQTVQAVRHFQILPAGGIAGEVADYAGVFHSWKIQPVAYEDTEQQPELHLHILRIDSNEKPELKSQIHLGDAIRSDVKPMIEQLKKSGYMLYMLSGDSKASCYQVARQLNIPLEHVFYGQTPEDKARFLQCHSAIMIGDGINDLEALSCAQVGISVQGGLEENVSQSDIYLAEQGILQLPEVLDLAHKTRRLLLFTLGFALVYNLSAIAAAVAGYINPLSAAILMPISAFIVMAIAVGGHYTWKS